jgi:hypothetical protein
VAKLSPQQRLENVVLSIGALEGIGLAAMDGAEVVPWMAEELRKGEAAVRLLRREVEQRLAGEKPRGCAECGRPFSGRADRRYCSARFVRADSVSQASVSVSRRKMSRLWPAPLEHGVSRFAAETGLPV